MTPSLSSEKVFDRIQLWLPFGIFLCLAGDSLGVFFTGDDVMNLFKYLERPQSWGWSSLAMFWSTAGYRPLGGVVYVALYKLVGFHPLPFRIFLLSVLVLNLVLYFRLARRLSGSRQVALWAILFGCYHAALNGLWLNFGTIYDVLGYSCFFGALLAYAAWVNFGACHRFPGIVAVVLLYLAGLELKEIVVTLPAVLLLWNIFFTSTLRRERWRWVLGSALPIVITGILGLIYIAGKMSGPESLAHDPNYAPHWTLQQYSTITAHYIGQIFYLPAGLPTPRAGLWILASMIAFAALLRSRLMVFCALSIIVTQLPVSFIAPRGGFAVYIPFAFWALYAATLAEGVMRLLPGPRHAFDAWIIAAAALCVIHVRMKPDFDPYYTVHSRVYEIFSRNLDAWHVDVRPNTRVLIVNDPFREDWVIWDPMFIVNLRSHTIQAVVYRQKLSHFLPPQSEIDAYDYVIDYDSAWLLLKRPAQPLLMSPHLRDLPANANVLLRDGFRPPIQGLWRETAPVFTIQTRAADTGAHQLAISLASYLFPTLSVQLDDGSPQVLAMRNGPSYDFRLPIPAGSANQVHTLTFRGGSANPKYPEQLLLVSAQLN